MRAKDLAESINKLGDMPVEIIGHFGERLFVSGIQTKQCPVLFIDKARIDLTRSVTSAIDLWHGDESGV